MLIESTVVIMFVYVAAAVEVSIFNKPVVVSIVIPAVGVSSENLIFPVPSERADVPPVVVSW